MLKFIPIFLLAVAVGCTQGDNADPVDVNIEVTDTDTGTETTDETTDETADDNTTLIAFHCPGMT